MSESTSVDADVLGRVIALLKQLPDEQRERVLRAAAAFYDQAPTPGGTYGRISKSGPSGNRTAGTPSFSESLEISPKEFMLQKQPRTDVERIATLAYYLTHYRDTPHFKTLDLSKLNTEAAQPKFANATWASNNALKRGYLVNATRGNRQLSAGGEQFVYALPDRDAAKKAMDRTRPRRRIRRQGASQSDYVKRQQ